MLRTPRTRLSSIKFLEKRIPKDLKDFNVTNPIFKTKYTVRIEEQKVVLVKD